MHHPRVSSAVVWFRSQALSKRARQMRNRHSVRFNGGIVGSRPLQMSRNLSKLRYSERLAIAFKWLKMTGIRGAEARVHIGIKPTNMASSLELVLYPNARVG